MMDIEKDLAEFAENDLKELLNTDYYAEALRTAGELDLGSLIENSYPWGSTGVVRNDRLITEASLGLISQLGSLTPLSGFFPSGAKPPNVIPIKTEHSYSLSEETYPKIPNEELSDLESECYPVVSIAEAVGQAKTKDLQNSKNLCSSESTSVHSGVGIPQTLPQTLPQLTTHSMEAKNHPPPLTPLMQQPPSQWSEQSGVEKMEESPEDMDTNGEDEVRSILQRHASTETLSCCGDCGGCHEEDIEFEEVTSTSPQFSFNNLNVQEVHLQGVGQNQNVNLQPHTQRAEEIPENNYHNYHPSTGRLTSLDEPSPPKVAKNMGCITFTNANALNTSKDLTGENQQQKNSPLIQHQNSIVSKYKETGFAYPPTPPSCSGSDSESGGHSPTRFSPLYERVTLPICTLKKGTPLGGKTSTRNPIHTPLISSQPKGATGTLYLTEEEKRTLLSEGYSIPSKLPLTKAEEKSLKKIRRKIKNKISAQESRRKKKEYMDTLEHKVDVLSQENSSYKKKVDSLQYRNKQLLLELQRLQELVNKDSQERSSMRSRTVLVQ